MPNLTMEKNTVQVGVATTYGHHGELIQGSFSFNNIEHRALVTLPFRQVHTTVKFIPNRSNVIETSDPNKQKSKKALELTSLYLNGNIIGGELAIESNIPIGKGYGSSTADVVSAIKAFAMSQNKSLTNLEIAQLAIQAEQASDSIMFTDQVILFAQREGSILSCIYDRLPKMKIVGLDTDSGCVDTLKMKLPSYTDKEKIIFNLILTLLRKGIIENNISLIGKATTASAIINQKYLCKPNFNKFLRISKEVGAAGIQISHSGTVVGFIFDPKKTYIEENIYELHTILKAMGYYSYEIEV
ncbi:GHMP family kinase ATP-binding protein [Bacillus wiedmannii]|uniref:GHMP family kinase ATP-binding protein n=1 Tax=Bacillus wiedmannii TaxID=1890302 RepID=UPI000BF7DA51|nr:hypothetical protein [Bacillus wiedmannii]PFY98368.1 hypothetical protein COL57_10825 [Bacillus wiedmannii]